jgi:hypothetical protein
MAKVARVGRFVSRLDEFKFEGSASASFFNTRFKNQQIEKDVEPPIIKEEKTVSKTINYHDKSSRPYTAN